jgi:ComF family protein
VISKDSLLAFKESLWEVLFPPSCVFCDSVRAESATGLCIACRDSIRPVSQPFCRQCGIPVAGLSLQGTGLCGRCLNKPPPYRKTRYGVHYEALLRDALIRFKFYGALHLSRTLSHILVETFDRHFGSDEIDLIVPVPLHRRKLLERGFNQVAVLSARLAGSTGLPLDRFALRKVKDTPPQVGLRRAQRVANLRNSFAVRDSGKIRGKSILLVDDVATTGSTIMEAAKTLMRGGASDVSALVLALRTTDSIVAASVGPNSYEEANHGIDDSGRI